METRKRKAEAEIDKEERKKQNVEKQMGWRKNLEGWEKEKFNITHNFQNSKARAFASYNKTKKYRESDAFGKAQIYNEVTARWSDEKLQERIAKAEQDWQLKNGPIQSNTRGWSELEKSQGTKFNPQEVVTWDSTDFFKILPKTIPNQDAPPNEKGVRFLI
jgi:hypothetical protein